MSEDSSSSSQSFFRKHWEGYKEFWGERFSFLDNYSRFIKRDKPLPSWSESDVEEFIASDPVHGPTVFPFSSSSSSSLFCVLSDQLICLHFNGFWVIHIYLGVYPSVFSLIRLYWSLCFLLFLSLFNLCFDFILDNLRLIWLIGTSCLIPDWTLVVHLLCHITIWVGGFCDCNKFGCLIQFWMSF